MTTICWTPGFLAADSAVTKGDENDAPLYKYSQQKLSYRKIDRTVFAIASQGDADCGYEVDALVLEQANSVYFKKTQIGTEEKSYLHWFNQPRWVKERKDIIDDNEYEAILFIGSHDENDDVILNLCDNGRFVEILQDVKYHAIGCDSPVALGALFNGADAETAIKAACKHAMYTGYPIHAIKRDEVGYLRFQTTDENGETISVVVG
jgi:hypothetical protein